MTDEEKQAILDTITNRDLDAIDEIFDSVATFYESFGDAKTLALVGALNRVFTRKIEAKYLDGESKHDRPH